MDHTILQNICFETDRLLVRRFRKEDAQGLFAMMSDQETCDLDGGYPAIAAMDERFMALVKTFAAEPDRFAVVLKETGETVGTIHLMDALPERCVPALEIGYVIAREYRRRGYAFEAVRAMVAHLHSEFNIPLVTAGAFGFNAPSQRMLEKLGFEREGVTRFAMAHPCCSTVDMINYIHFDGR